MGDVFKKQKGMISIPDRRIKKREIKQYLFVKSNLDSILKSRDIVHKTVLYISVSFAVSYTGLLLPSF